MPDEEPVLDIQQNLKRSNSFDADTFYSNLSYTPSIAAVINKNLEIKTFESNQKDSLDDTNMCDFHSIEDIKRINSILKENQTIIDNQEADEIVIQEEFNNQNISNLEQNIEMAFPGEIIDHSETLNKLHVTKLDIETILVSEKVSGEVEDSSAFFTDVVECFNLDATHDYNKNHSKPRFDFLNN